MESWWYIVVVDVFCSLIKMIEATLFDWLADDQGMRTFNVNWRKKLRVQTASKSFIELQINWSKVYPSVSLSHSLHFQIQKSWELSHLGWLRNLIVKHDMKSIITSNRFVKILNVLGIWLALMGGNWTQKFSKHTIQKFKLLLLLNCRRCEDCKIS